MKAEKHHKKLQQADFIQPKERKSNLNFVDKRQKNSVQTKLINSIQQKENQVKFSNNPEIDSVTNFKVNDIQVYYNTFNPIQLQRWINSNTSNQKTIQREKIDKTEKELKIELEDLSVKILDKALCGKGEECMVSNSEYMSFSINYTLTNLKSLERNIKVGLVQQVIKDNVWGDYENEKKETVRISIDTGKSIPFIDAYEDTFPFYDSHSVSNYTLEGGEIVEGNLEIKDRSNIAIPYIIKKYEIPYFCKSLTGERVFDISFHVLEKENIIATIPICRWKYDIQTGKVTVQAQ